MDAMLGPELQQCENNRLNMLSNVIRRQMFEIRTLLNMHYVTV